MVEQDQWTHANGKSICLMHTFPLFFVEKDLEG